jgi:hypothetical protein
MRFRAAADVRRRLGRAGGRRRLARALGLDRNPLCRATDRAEAWIRAGLLVIFLVAGPMAALGAGHWASHLKVTAAPVPAVAATYLAPARLQPSPASTDRPGAGQGDRAGSRTRPDSSRSDARLAAAMAVVLTLGTLGVALMSARWLTLVLLTRRRLAAWDAAWSRVGPQWSGRAP